LTFRFPLIDFASQLDSYEISEGKTLKLNVSEPKTRLFIGNIPKSKGREEIEEEFKKLSGKVLHVSLSKN
jgi:RNA recognition motif-containing protein